MIVDDEPFARERVRRLLAAEEGIEVVGQASDGFQAVAAIKEQSPDLLFLDVQMPGKDGFSVLDEIPAEQTPVVIFLTAYDTYAVRAFEAAALDYLLKPFDEERFHKAVARARVQLIRLARFRNGDTEDEAQLAQVAGSEASGSQAKHLERVIIKAGGRVIFRRTDEIDWIEAYGNYVRLHLGRSAYLLRETISNLEAQLDPAKFVRIHRSTLIQVDRVREMQPQLGGQYKVILMDGTSLRLSRRYRRNLPKLNQSL